MSTVATILSFGWQPEIRGISSVLIMFVVLCGSVYLLLATNVGSRLGFLLAIAGFAGWNVGMGIIWLVYGGANAIVGIQGPAPRWVAEEVIIGDLTQAADRGVHDLSTNGWRQLAPEDQTRGQTQAAADAYLGPDGQRLFGATSEYSPVDVYLRGGDSWPKIGAFDFFAFFRDEEQALVQVRPNVNQPQEPGRPPPRPVIDESQPTYSVLMVRDLGQRRLPATWFTLGNALLLGWSCWLLHERDQRARRNREGGAAAATVPSRTGVAVS